MWIIVIAEVQHPSLRIELLQLWLHSWPWCSKAEKVCNFGSGVVFVSMPDSHILRHGGQITVFVGPLDPGSYEFFDDFHNATRGHLVVK